MVYRADHNTAICPRCGLQRRVKESRGAEYCVDCRSVLEPARQLVRAIAKEADPVELPGRWVRKGLVWRWQKPVMHTKNVDNPPQNCGRPLPKNSEVAFDESTEQTRIGAA